MCGVFGFISNDNFTGPDLDRIARIAAVTETRGRHAHGLAWIDASGRLRQFKRAGRITDNADWLERIRGARVVIGHCRFATRGNPENLINNHPHPCDGGWIVHNGTAYNAERLACEWDLHPNSTCDSEVIGGLIETIEGETLLERVQNAVELLEGPGVVLGLWARPARLLIVRRGKPLHVSGCDEGLYFGSLPAALNDADRILDNTARLYEFRNGEPVQTIREIVPCRKRKPERNPPLGRMLRLFDRDLTASRERVWSE